MSQKKFESIVAQSTGAIDMLKSLSANKDTFMLLVSSMLAQYRAPDMFKDEDAKALKKLIEKAKEKKNSPHVANENKQDTHKALEQVQSLLQDKAVADIIAELAGAVPQRTRELAESIAEKPLQESMREEFNRLASLTPEQAENFRVFMSEKGQDQKDFFLEWVGQADEKTLGNILFELNLRISNKMIAELLYNLIKVVESEEIFERGKTIADALKIQISDKAHSKYVGDLALSIRNVLQVVEDVLYDNLPPFDKESYIQQGRDQKRKTDAFFASLKR